MQKLIGTSFDKGVRPKDGRERTLKRIAKAIASQSPGRRARILSTLSKEGKSQTEGWIEVIKRNQVKPFVATGTALTKQVTKYLDEARPLLEQYSASASQSSFFKEIFKTSLAAETILLSLTNERFCPSLEGLRTIALRYPLLLSLGQSSVAHLELRRFLELTFWTVFFTHHPIEWSRFVSKNGGFGRDMTRPITFAAHRELNSYMDYAREYMESEPSGLALKVIQALESDKKQLNASVHAGDLARNPHHHPAIDTFSDKELKVLGNLQRRIFSHSILLLCAFDVKGFNKLPHVPRAYFDWLMGPSLQKKIRAGSFGLTL